MAAFDLTEDWTKVADASDALFTIQARSELGMEAIFWTEAGAPEATDEGLRVKPLGLVTRAMGTGHVFVRAIRRLYDYRTPGRVVVMR